MNAPLIDKTKMAGLTLKKGGHRSPDAGLCLMEAVAYVCGIDHTDHPACVAPVLGEMGRSLNDVLPDDLRQQLVPLVPDLPGTAGDGHDEERSYTALDWLIRTWLPTWLELSPTCREVAAKVRELGRIVDLASAERAGPVVRNAQETAVAAGAAARDAARDAAWDASWDAARAAAWDASWDAARAAARAAAGAAARDAARAAAGAAAGDAAGAAAGAAAGDAAGAAAWDAAGAAAWDAARDAAWDAAWDAAGAAAGAAAWDAARAAAGGAAWDAARAALQPTVTQLQQSAIELYSRMVHVGNEHPS